MSQPDAYLEAGLRRRRRVEGTGGARPAAPMAGARVSHRPTATTGIFGGDMTFTNSPSQ